MTNLYRPEQSTRKCRECDEVSATTEMKLKGRECEDEDESRSRGQRSNGRGTYDRDQPPIIVLADRESGMTYTIPARNVDQPTTELILGVNAFIIGDC